jgi:competence protein ComEC
VTRRASERTARSDAVEDVAEPAPAGEVVGPVVPWVLAVAVGAATGERLGDAGLPGWGSVTIGAVAALALVATVRTARRRRRGGTPPHEPGTVGLGIAVAVAALLVGIAGSALRASTTERGLLPALAASGGSRPVVGRVVHEPHPTAVGWHVVLRVTEVAGRPTRERAVLVVDDDPPPLGRTLRGVASARPLPEGGYGRWLARQHATVLLDAGRWELAGAPRWHERYSERFRQRVRDAAAARAPPAVAGLLAGFVTGDTRGLPTDDADAMRATGLTHLTAVSGTHVAVLVAGVLALTWLVRLGAAGRRLVLALVLVAFAFTTRFQPSVLRAGTVGLVVLLADARGLSRDARHVLAVAVLLLLLLDPLLAGSLGLVLSATAAAGVLVLTPLVRDRLPSRVPRRLGDVIAVTVGAQLAVVPVLLTSFGEVPLASLPANVVAVPAAVVAVGIAFAASVVSLVSVDVAAWGFALAGVPARVVLWSAHRFADAGGVVRASSPAAVAALVAAAGWLLLPRTRPRGRQLAAGVTLVALLCGAVPTVLGGRAPGTFVVTAIDVGQGDAFLLETPAARVLVDAGEDGTAARWLREHGRRELDLLVVTHGHLDHIGGAAEVVRRLGVREVWYRPFPTDLPEARELLEAAAERGVPVLAPVAGDRALVGDLALEVLSPPPGRPYRWSRSELNDSSLVVLATWRDRRVLATGDVEAAAQADLLALPETLGRPDLLRVEVLTVPHHGSATTDPAFLAAVAPPVALISAGRDNRHGHPHPSIVAVLERLGAEVHRTDLEGTVRVEVPAPVGSPHASRAPPRRRRRPAAAPRARAAARGPSRGRSRADRRDLRRARDRPPAGAAHGVAVRRADLRRAARGREPVRRPEGRGRGLPGRADRRGRPDPRRQGGRAGPEGRQAGQGARRAGGRQGAGGLGRPGLGAPRRRGVPAAAAQG